MATERSLRIGKAVGFLTAGTGPLLLARLALAQEDVPAVEAGEGELPPAPVESVDFSSITFDEVLVWVMVGFLVGSLVGLFVTRRLRGFGAIGNLILGVVAAVIGGLAVEFLKIDAGLGQINVSYEELIASILAALVIVGGLQIFLRRRTGGKDAKKSRQETPQASK